MCKEEAAMKIILTQRSDDYLAHVEGKEWIWGHGATPDEAIGNVVRRHLDVFKIQIAINHSGEGVDGGREYEPLLHRASA
jgi:hypothetical protein